MTMNEITFLSWILKQTMMYIFFLDFNQAKKFQLVIKRCTLIQWQWLHNCIHTRPTNSSFVDRLPSWEPTHWQPQFDQPFWIFGYYLDFYHRIVAEAAKCEINNTFLPHLFQGGGVWHYNIFRKRSILVNLREHWGTTGLFRHFLSRQIKPLLR